MAGNDFYMNDAKHPTPEDVEALSAIAAGIAKKLKVTPLERAALTLQDALLDSCDRGRPFLSDYRAAVRAVLTAIREPSEAMKQAGRDAFVSCGDYVVDSDEAWKFMIDAALAEGK